MLEQREKLNTFDLCLEYKNPLYKKDEYKVMLNKR